LCSILIAVPVADLCTGDEVLLRWKPKPGVTFRITMRQKIQSETSVGEHADEISFETRMEMDWRVNRIDADGSIRLTQTYQRFRLESTVGDTAPLVYDSASNDSLPDELKPVARVMQPLVGIQTALVLSDRGEVLDAEGLPESESRLGDLPSTARWKQMLTGDGMRRVLQQALGQLPESPVDVGDQWDHTVERSSPLGTLRIESIYTYDRTVQRGGRNLEQIRGATTAKLSELASDAPPSQKLHYQPQPSVFLFDNEAGYLVESHVTQAVGSEVPYGDTRIRVKTSGTITLKIAPAE
jgi:hypothetical protein